MDTRVLEYKLLDFENRKLIEELFHNFNLFLHSIN